MKVLIIGAGPAGLAAAKEAKARGLDPDVFEMADSIGGVWRKGGLAWEQMQVNISRFTGVFSDFPWDDTKPVFPTTEDMRDYLIAYAKHFNLDSYIKLKHRVTQVKKSGKGWAVIYMNDDGEQKEEFYDAVIVASGKYGKPVLPAINGINDFQGEKLHSSEFYGQEFKGKKVLVVGGSTSGASITETLANSCEAVVHVFRRPRYLMPRFVPTGYSFNGPELPHDLIKTRERQKALSLTDQYDYYKRLCGKQNRLQAWAMTERDRFGVVIADTYIEKVDAKKILPYKDDIDHFEKAEVVFKSGRRESVDAVIFCTGYTPDLSFFEKELLDQFNLDLPMYSLFKHTFHPDYPNLAFIALTYQGLGAVFPSAELQAAMACEFISGRQCLPSPEDLRRDIVGMTPLVEGLQLNDSLASSLNWLPYFPYISSRDGKLYELLWHGAAVPAQYRLQSGEEDTKRARETLEKTDQYRRQCLSGKTENANLGMNYQASGLFGKSLREDFKLLTLAPAPNDNQDTCTYQ